mmetsp:Transcript_9795/g.36868  ORF Transcript_9795/g.36868 Transcript_9795/m.36868 type:complete len:430 (+) Transcript_9795:705-1994(+)
MPQRLDSAFFSLIKYHSDTFRQLEAEGVNLQLFLSSCCFLRRGLLPFRLLHVLDGLQHALGRVVHVHPLALRGRHEHRQAIANLFLMLASGPIARLAGRLAALLPLLLGHELQHAVRPAFLHVVHAGGGDVRGHGHLLRQRHIPQRLQSGRLALQRHHRVGELLVLRQLQNGQRLEKRDGIVRGGVARAELRLPDDATFGMKQNAPGDGLRCTHLALDAVDAKAEGRGGERKHRGQQGEEDDCHSVLGQVGGVARPKIAPEVRRHDEVLRARVEERVHGHDGEQLQEQQRDLLRPRGVGPDVLRPRPDARAAHVVHHAVVVALVHLAQSKDGIAEPPRRQRLGERDTLRLLVVHVIDGPVCGVEAEDREHLVLQQQRALEVLPHLLHVVDFVLQLRHDEVQAFQVRLGPRRIGKRGVDGVLRGACHAAG